MQCAQYVASIWLAASGLPYAAADSAEPVLHFPFDRIEGQFAPAAAGSGCRAQLGRSADVDSADPTLAKDGRFRSGLSFDRDDVAVIPAAAAHAFQVDQSFTIEFWVKILTSDTSVRADLVRKTATDGRTWVFRLQNKGRLGFVAKAAGGRRTADVLCPRNCLRRWHHVAFVRDAVERMVRFYVDGEIVREMPDRTPADQFDFAAPIVLGGPRPFPWVLDEFCVTGHARRRFALDAPPSAPAPALESVYRPAHAVVETPDPDVAASWRAMDAHGVSIVPAPKRITFTGRKIPLTPGWTLVTDLPGVQAGLDEINRRIEELGAAPLPVAESAPGPSVVVRTLDAGQEAPEGIGDLPRRQGYVIRFQNVDGRARILVVGRDLNGARYGCVTLARLLRKGPVWVEAKVRDWPDFKYRMGFRGYGKRADTVKAYLDQAFRAKINLVWAAGFGTTFEKLLETAEARKPLFDYARARGIRIVTGNYLDVGRAPYPADMAGFSAMYYPYKTEEGLIGHRGRAFTWSRDDLIDKRAELMAQYMKQTGTDAFYLHAMDTGARDNPENWGHRTPMDKARWGDDRAAADANLMGRIYARMRAENPDVLLFAVAYPYGATYLEYPDIRAWLSRLSALLPESIYFCVREGVRKDMAVWRDATRQGRFVYHAPYPSSMRLMFHSGGRFARTFYFDDRDVYWYLPSTDSMHLPGIWVAAEYAWNTLAPGWGWVPSGRRGMPGIDASPPEVTKSLLRRVTTIVFGPASAENMRKAYMHNLSCRLASNLMSFSGADPEAYFRAKAEAAVEALKCVDAEKDRFSQSSRWLYPGIRGYVFNAVHLLDARHRYFLARRLLASDDYDGARRAVTQAKAALARLPSNQYDAVRIAADLDIASTIEWCRERKRYLGTLPATRDVVLALYSRGFYEGVEHSFAGVPGVRVVRFEDPTRDFLRSCSLVFFAATSDMGDTTEDCRGNIRAFVEAGGGAVFTHNAVGRRSGSAFAKPLFPEVCAGYAGRLVGERTLTATETHPAIAPLRAGDTLEHEYGDHLCPQPGPQCTVLLRNSRGQPVMLVGQVGRGRVVYTGQIFGLTRDNVKRESVRAEWKLLHGLVRWVGAASTL